MKVQVTPMLQTNSGKFDIHRKEWPFQLSKIDLSEMWRDYHLNRSQQDHLVCTKHLTLGYQRQKADIKMYRNCWPTLVNGRLVTNYDHRLKW